MRSSLFNLHAERAGRLSWTDTLPVWKIKKLEKNDKERKGQKSGWVTQCIMTLFLRNRSWKPSECNRSRNFYQLLTVGWNYEWFQWVSPRVHSGARVRRKASELLCLSQLPPMWFIFLSGVQFCTSPDIFLLKRMIQLIISLSAVLPQKPRNGQMRREMSVFTSKVGFAGAKRHNIKQYCWCCPGYMRSEKWRRWTKSILYSIWSASSLTSFTLPDAFLSRVHHILSFLRT